MIAMIHVLFKQIWIGCMHIMEKLKEVSTMERIKSLEGTVNQCLFRGNLDYAAQGFAHNLHFVHAQGQA